MGIDIDNFPWSKLVQEILEFAGLDNSPEETLEETGEMAKQFVIDHKR